MAVMAACLRKGAFTIGALDNIDHNPTSITAASSFHGTGVSMFQLLTVNNTDKERPPVTLPPKGTGHALPEEYATVHPLELDTSKAVVPFSLMKEPEKQREVRWFEYSLGKLDEGSVSSSETVTWAAKIDWYVQCLQLSQ